MRDAARLVLLLAILAAAACGRTAGEPDALPPARGAALLIDRNWMDRWPTDARERLQVYRFTPAMGGGVFQDRTLFAGHFELFKFEIRGDVLELKWPDRHLREQVRFRVVPVAGPAPFDLRLELEGNEIGPPVLYGRSAETGAPPGEVARALALP